MDMIALGTALAAGKGGRREVADIAARNLIPAARRTTGMVVFVQSNGIAYRLVGGIADANWTPLPTAPTGLRPRPLLAAVGDSRQAQGASISGATKARMMTTPWSWLPGLLFGRVAAPISYNKAVGGSFASDLPGQIDNVLALSPRPSHCLILSGTNSFNANIDFATVRDQIKAAWSKLLVAGIIPVQITDLPRTWANASYLKHHERFNSWLRQEAGGYGVILVDPTAQLVDVNSSTGEPIEAYMQEAGITPKALLHPGPAGAYLVAQDIRDTFLAQVPMPLAYRGIGRGDAYDATINTTGNLVVNGGLMIGSAGTTNGSGTLSGSVATGWIGRADSGSPTIAFSKENRADGSLGEWQVLDFSGSGTSQSMLYQQGTFGLVPGDTVQYAVDVWLTANTNVDGIRVQLKDTVGGGTVNGECYAMHFNPVTTPGFKPPATFKVRLETDPLTLSASYTALRIDHTAITSSAGGSGTVKFGAAELRKVVSAS